jgi:hypothetical protein
MNNIFKVYALVDFDNTIKYIGITSKDIIKRLQQHINTSINKTINLSKKEAWIKNRYNNNNKIDIILLEEDLTKESAIELEISYISYYGLDSLKNSTLGGEGLFGYKYTPEQLANWYNLKPIKEFDISGNYVTSFTSITEAASFYNYTHSSVAYCVNNTNITCHNKIFVVNDLTFLEDKLVKLSKKQYFLYNLEGTLIDTDKTLNNLYRKYNLHANVNTFSKRVWNGFIPEMVKHDYFITTPNTDYKVILDRINIYQLYDLNCNYVKSFSKLSQIAIYLKCSYQGITEHIRKRLKSIKGHLIFKNNILCSEYSRDNIKKVAVYKNGIKVFIFNSIKEASIALNTDASCITKCCKGKRKQAKKYEFRYINDIV